MEDSQRERVCGSRGFRRRRRGIGERLMGKLGIGRGRERRESGRWWNRGGRWQ